MNKKFRVAQLWYSPEQYAEVKTMMEDADLLPDAYALWREGAEQREEQARRGGALVVRVPFDPAEFRRFCAHRKIPLDTKARQQLAAIVAAQMSENVH